MLGDDFPAALAGARAGSEAAFERLWRDVNPTLERYLRVLVGPAAEDVAAETWISIVAGLERFTGDEPAWRSWLFTIARRRAVDEQRRRARRPVTAGLPADDDTTAAAEPDSAEQAVANLEHERLVSALRTLPRQQAEVVLLRVIAGLDTERVAAVVGRSPGAVRVALHRGLRTLAGTFYASAAPAGETPGDAAAIRRQP